MALNKEIILEGEIGSIAGFSGKKQRCPECGRETDKNFCAVHAEVNPEEEFSMTVKVNGKKAEIKEEHFKKITGFNSQKIEGLPENEKMSLLKKKFEGKKIRATGKDGGNKFYPEELDVMRG